MAEQGIKMALRQGWQSYRDYCGYPCTCALVLIGIIALIVVYIIYGGN